MSIPVTLTRRPVVAMMKLSLDQPVMMIVLLIEDQVIYGKPIYLDWLYV